MLLGDYRYQWNNRAASRRPTKAASAILLSYTLLILFIRERGLWNCTQNAPKIQNFTGSGNPPLTWKKFKKIWGGAQFFFILIP